MSEQVCLVVDDDPAIRSYLVRILIRQGWRCLEAANAADGQRMVEGLQGAVDLVLTDIEMPGETDGIGLAHWLRASFPGIPVILVTGSGEHPAEDFPLVSKPCKPEAILAAVSGITRRGNVLFGRQVREG